jgi:hypothetical protein
MINLTISITHEGEEFILNVSGECLDDAVPTDYDYSIPGFAIPCGGEPPTVVIGEYSLIGGGENHTPEMAKFLVEEYEYEINLEFWRHWYNN